MDGGRRHVARADAGAAAASASTSWRFVAQLVMAWMLAGILLHLARGGLPATLWNGVISGAFIWLGFVITTMVVNYAFHGARHALTLIDGGHWLGVLLIQGAILGWWGLR